MKITAKLEWKPKHHIDGFCCCHCAFNESLEHCPTDDNGKLKCNSGFFMIVPESIKVKKKKRKQEAE